MQKFLECLIELMSNRNEFDKCLLTICIQSSTFYTFFPILHISKWRETITNLLLIDRLMDSRNVDVVWENWHRCLRERTKLTFSLFHQLSIFGISVTEMEATIYETNTEMRNWGYILLGGSCVSFLVGSWSMLIAPFMNPTGNLVSRITQFTLIELTFISTDFRFLATRSTL